MVGKILLVPTVVYCFQADFLGTTFKETDDESNPTQISFKNGVLESIYFRIDSDEYDYSKLRYLFAFKSNNTDEFGEFYVADFSYLTFNCKKSHTYP